MNIPPNIEEQMIATLWRYRLDCFQAEKRGDRGSLSYCKGKHYAHADIMQRMGIEIPEHKTLEEMEKL